MARPGTGSRDRIEGSPKCPLLKGSHARMSTGPSIRGSPTDHRASIASLLYCIISYTSSIGHRGLCAHLRNTRERKEENARDVRQPERPQGSRARRRVRDSTEALDFDSPQAHCRFRCVLMTGLTISIHLVLFRLLSGSSGALPSVVDRSLSMACLMETTV